jgi:hypothetical protein
LLNSKSEDGWCSGLADLFTREFGLASDFLAADTGYFISSSLTFLISLEEFLLVLLLELATFLSSATGGFSSFTFFAP